jgi:L-alanine-DL-glutamate epimerase-like enolase superfamily enzyme
VDTALVDIAAKSYGIPASKLLGGTYRKEIPLYASLLFDMDDVEGTAKKGLRYIRDNYFGVKFGWGMIPSKPFGADPDRDEKMIASIRDAFGTKGNIMVDVGRYVNWSSDHAIRMAKRLEKYNIFWLEEALPQDDMRGYQRLTNSVDVTIAFGEGLYTVYDFADVISRQVADLIQPDASKLGGISEMKRIIELARINNMRWVPHNWSTAINSAASMQLVASAPDAFLMEFKQEENPLVSDLSKEKFKIENGKLIVPDNPGLGIEIDQNVVDKYRWEP